MVWHFSFLGGVTLRQAIDYHIHQSKAKKETPPTHQGSTVGSPADYTPYLKQYLLEKCPSSDRLYNAWCHPEIAETIIPSPRSDTAIIHSKDSGRIYFFWRTGLRNGTTICMPVMFLILLARHTTFSPRRQVPLPEALNSYLPARASRHHLLLLSSLRVPKERLRSRGILKGDDVIACSAPEFSSYDSDEPVHDTVRIGPNRFTNNAFPFNFFSATDANQTLAFGPGILSGIGRDIETSFVIRAKDETSRDRVCGMDKFTIKIIQRACLWDG
eukprot:scaffold383_cov20-Cyclotella_meneghiniana.AAC.1